MIGVVQTRGCLCPAGWGLCGLGYTMASAGALPSDLRKIVLWSFWDLVLFWFAHPSSEMTIYILERSVLGGTRPLLAADVYAFLQNVSRKVQTITLSICLESSSLDRYSPWKPPSMLLLLIVTSSHFDNNYLSWQCESSHIFWCSFSVRMDYCMWFADMVLESIRQTLE